jgi:hypothetical protein
VRKNRSQIDFFLTSVNLIDRNTECLIADACIGSFFDHKTVTLKFPALVSHRRQKRLIIRNEILADPDIDIVTWFTVFETYLIHLKLEGVSERDIEESLLKCGQVRKLLRDAGPDPQYYLNKISEEIISNRDNCMRKIKTVLNDFPIDLLYNFT